ncbi:MAG: spermidine synthase [Pirellulales bacterium]
MNLSPCRTRTSLLGLSYAAAILLSALLVFQVQLLISKSILPWFGGTPAVWTTCMLFFQVVLFAGYAYAHASIARLRPAAQGALHLLLIFLAVAWLPVMPSPDWKPHEAGNPVLYILALLAVCVGFPFFVLSATGPLLQGWFARTHQNESPYRLYALSNIGSLVGLVSYPFLVEPELPLTSQSAYWSLGFTIFALFCGYCALQAWQRSRADILKEDGLGPRPAKNSSEMSGADRTVEESSSHVPSLPARRGWAWLALAACASVMLLATTNHVCQDVAVIPFLWVAPLTLYLLTFIICFEKEHWYSRRWCAAAAAVSLAGAAVLLLASSGQNLMLELAVCMSALFFVCMVCHGELVRLKPSPRHLTRFYLMTSAGGAVGGIFVALIAPLAFNSHLEYTLGILVSYVLALAIMTREVGLPVRYQSEELVSNGSPVTGGSSASGATAHWPTGGRATSGTPTFGFARAPAGRRRALQIAALLAIAGLIPVLRCQTLGRDASSCVTARGFYGVLHVDDVDREDPLRHGLVLRYGRILHGYQLLHPTLRREPTLYYGRQSGVGLALGHHPRRAEGLRVGLVGLGVGTLAAYGQENDYLRFYEINPDVVRVAQEEFSFLADCPAKTDVVLGDARISLERELPQAFDLLALDAFSGDAIPTHLLTREALQVYLRHLKPDGALVVHITNRHVDLVPVLRALAEHCGLQMATIETSSQLDAGITASTWAILTNDRELLHSPAVQAATSAGPREKQYAHCPLWTDDYSNIFQIMR